MPDLMLVAGGIRRTGGQDLANLELARFVAFSGTRRLTIVSNRIDPEVHSFPNTGVHLVPAPFGSTTLGEVLLRAAASRIAKTLPPTTVVLSNGGNFQHATVTWIHCVHAA